MRETFVLLLLSFIFMKTDGLINEFGNQSLIGHHEILPELRPGEVCTPGQVYKDACNTCKCTNSHRLLCTRMACIDHNLFESLQHQHPRVRKSISKPILRQRYKPNCVPGRMYKKDCNRCFCTENRALICTIIACQGKGQTHMKSLRSEAEEGSSTDVIPILDDNGFVKLPSLNHQSSQCQPGKTYRVQCNTCVCRDNGNLMCTAMLCKSFLVNGMASALRQSGLPCNETQNYESECLKCECRNSISHCEALPNCNPPALRSITRKYNRICRSKIQCDLAMDPELEQCTPGETYFDNCNRCICQENGTLRCTQKKCLNYTESQQLKKQRLLLVNNP